MLRAIRWVPSGESASMVAPASRRAALAVTLFPAIQLLNCSAACLRRWGAAEVNWLR